MASFETSSCEHSDMHPDHYSRMCTPNGCFGNQRLLATLSTLLWSKQLALLSYANILQYRFPWNQVS